MTSPTPSQNGHGAARPGDLSELVDGRLKPAGWSFTDVQVPEPTPEGIVTRRAVALRLSTVGAAVIVVMLPDDLDRFAAEACRAASFARTGLHAPGTP